MSAGMLEGVRVLDLSRILAGPSCTQLLGDLGADVIKVERPGGGDDTRGWGPPFVEASDAGTRSLSAYYLCANRNKRSIAIDLAAPEGAALVRRLVRESDVLVENFKVGDLARYGLSYAELRAEHPRLVFCSITGFGQTGPLAPRPGYDFLAQAMGGLMSLTGAPDGEPVKVGVGIADLMCGMYAAVAILAALRHRDRTGEGQHLDLSLYDTQIAWLANEGVSHLTTGELPVRRGNAHATIVPYQAFETADGWIVLAVGNDAQFARFCGLAGLSDLPGDPRFATNAARVENRDACVARVRDAMRARTTDAWVETLEAAGVPSGPVRTLDRVMCDPHTIARDMRIRMSHPGTARGSVELLGNPIHASATPPTYRLPPPHVGADTGAVLRERLDLSEAEVEALRARGIVGGS